MYSATSESALTDKYIYFFKFRHFQRYFRPYTSMQNFSLYKKGPMNFDRQSKLHLRNWRLKNEKPNRTLKFKEIHRILENNSKYRNRYTRPGATNRQIVVCWFRREISHAGRKCIGLFLCRIFRSTKKVSCKNTLSWAVNKLNANKYLITINVPLFSKRNEQIRIQWVTIYKIHFVTRCDLLVDTAVHSAPGLWILKAKKSKIFKQNVWQVTPVYPTIF